MTTLYYESELYHHGIKGMKWGVRRFQKKDGSLTPAGKKRYTDDPTVQKSKQTYETAMKRYKESRKELDRTYNKASYVPTKKNMDAYKKAQKTYNDDQHAYKKAKFKYDTNKETARISAKNVEFKNKSKHRLKLEEQYRKQGLSKEQAEAAANNRIRTEKILATSAAMTVGACAAYYAHKSRKSKIDQIVKAGESLQRIEMRNTNGQLHNTFYTSIGKHDNTRYERLLGFARKNTTGEAYMMKLEATKDVKVASRANAAKIFKELCDTDPEFGAYAKNTWHVPNDAKTGSRAVKSAYERFNKDIVFATGRPQHTAMNQKFYDKLKESGYGAIQDINDMKFSGYNAKNPLIIFDNSSAGIMVKSVSEIKKPSFGKATIEQAKALGEMEADRFMTTYGPLTAAGLAGSAAYSYATDPVDYVEKGKTKKKTK